MISLKTKEEIEKLAKGGAILAAALEELKRQAKVGMTGKQLDMMARQFLADHDTKPAFLGYGPRGGTPFPAALCVSVNDGVVHGLPNDTPLKDGDVVKLDLGLIYDGLYVDSARTVVIGVPTDEVKRLLQATHEALMLGIAQAKIGHTTGDIGAAIQEFLDYEGLGIVRQLVGHGVGHAVHEEPQVPNFGKYGKGVKLEEGLVIAIEPMVTLGGDAVYTDKDGWTVRTADGSLAAHEEHTVAVTADGPRILTQII
jgi:methionyl aminopeptidase